MAALVNDKGFLILTVPANKFLWNRHDEINHHYRRYSKKELMKIIPPDLSIKKVSYFNTLLFPMAILDKLVFSKNKRSYSFNPNPAVNGILYRIFSAEKSMVRFFNLPFGVSILLIAEKGIRVPRASMEKSTKPKNMQVDIKDLNHILEHTSPLWEDMRGQNIFITGGTGYFGCWLLESFTSANDRLRLAAKATVLSRNPAAFVTKAPHLANHPSVHLIQGDVRDFEFPKGEFRFVIHAATEASAKLNRRTRC